MKRVKGIWSSQGYTLISTFFFLKNIFLNFGPHPSWTIPMLHALVLCRLASSSGLPTCGQCLKCQPEANLYIPFSTGPGYIAGSRCCFWLRSWIKRISPVVGQQCLTLPHPITWKSVAEGNPLVWKCSCPFNIAFEWGGFPQKVAPDCVNRSERQPTGKDAEENDQVPQLLFLLFLLFISLSFPWRWQ